MAKAGQYWNGTDWVQTLITDDDLLMADNKVATTASIKDSHDNLFIICIGGLNNYDRYFKVIKITKDGVKSVSKSTNLVRIASTWTVNDINQVVSRDGSKIFLWVDTPGTNSNIISINTADINGNDFTYSNVIETAATPKFAIYKDLYIWVAFDATVKIYDYTTKTCIDTDGATIIASLAICCSTGNILYSASNGKLQVITFNAGASTITDALSVATIECAGITSETKQLHIDPFGDLIILTNSGTASTLLKYTTEGVLKDTKDLAAPSYNLNIDTKGNYYYQTALKTYKIDKNGAQGQAFNAIPIEPIRGTGNAGYGSNMTGYQPSINA